MPAMKFTLHYNQQLSQINHTISQWFTLQNKAFIDIRLCPGVATPLAPYGPLHRNVTSSIKPEVHNVSQSHQRRTKPWPQGICTTNFVTIGPVVPEICSWTDRHTDRNTLLPYQGAVTIECSFCAKFTRTSHKAPVV